MDARPDVRTLKTIYEAERRADRILRKAEEDAVELLRRTDAEAGETLSALHRDLPPRRREGLEKAVSSIEKESSGLLEEARSRTERWAGRRRAGIDRIVDRLLEMVLPP